MMKKLIGSILCVCSIGAFLFLGGIWFEKQERQQKPDHLEQQTEETVQKENETSEADDKESEKETGDAQKYGVGRQTKQRTGYAYDNLAADERIIYAEVLEGLTELREETVVSTLDAETLERVFEFVMSDHPEIFYVDGYTYTKYQMGDEVQKITFHGNLTHTKEEIAERQSRINEKTEEIFARMPQGLDDYHTVKYLYEYVINNTEYNLLAEDNQNICSVFLNGESVCQGYAKALEYLLQEAGMEAALVTGTVSGGEGHAWNLVRMDQAWYYVDATWGDASYQIEEGSDEYGLGEIPSINYDYLGVTTDQLLMTHQISNNIPMPQCTNLADNYYVQEGAYFTDINTEQFKLLFDGALMREQGFVTLKCADSDIYQQIRDYLLVQQKIFDYLDTEDGVLAYYDSSSQCTIGVWLP